MPPSSHDSSSALDPASVAALLFAAQRGHAGALDDLIRVCEPLVRRHARRYAWHRNDVDDIVQDVWICLLRRHGQIREPRTLIAWLHVVTRRAAAQVGHRSARVVPIPVDAEPASPSSTEDEVIGCHGRRAITNGVRMALDRLHEDDRHLLLLLHRDDRPGYDDISRQVGRPIGSLGPTRRRLLERLRRDRHIVGLKDLRPAS